MVLLTCAILLVYPQNNNIGASALCGFISTAGTPVSGGFRDAEADAENEPAEDREAVNN